MEVSESIGMFGTKKWKKNSNLDTNFIIEIAGGNT